MRVRGYNIRIFVPRRAINLNTISVAPYCDIMHKRRASNAHCSTRWMLAPSTRRSLRSSLFSEGASRIMQDIAVLYIFKGCCWKLRAKGGKKNGELHAYVCTLYYVQYPRHDVYARACHFVGLRDGFSEGEVREFMRKNLSSDVVRRISNLHNALFTWCEQKRANCLHAHFCAA